MLYFVRLHTTRRFGMWNVGYSIDGKGVVTLTCSDGNDPIPLVYEKVPQHFRCNVPGFEHVFFGVEYLQTGVLGQQCVQIVDLESFLYGLGRLQTSIRPSLVDAQ